MYYIDARENHINNGLQWLCIIHLMILEVYNLYSILIIVKAASLIDLHYSNTLAVILVCIANIFSIKYNWIIIVFKKRFILILMETYILDRLVKPNQSRNKIKLSRYHMTAIYSLTKCTYNDSYHIFKLTQAYFYFPFCFFT